MKINFIMPGLGDSGGIQIVKKYAKELSNMGHDVVIYCPIVAYNLHRFKNPIIDYVHKLYCTGKTIVKKNVDTSLEKWILSVNNRTIRDADVTIATMWATAYDVHKLGASKGEKCYFIQGFEIWDNKEWGLNSYKLPLKKIVISTWINNKLKENLGIGPFPVITNGIDTGVYFDQHIRKQNGKVFLMLNHSMKTKGVQYGLEVFEKVKEKYPEAKLIMFGMCENDNLPSYVEYYKNPSKKTLVKLYSTSNFFIFPSLEEGWGLTPIEAMACGSIVFGTKTGFVLDVGKHAENMMISSCGNVDEMFENIDILLKEDRLREYIQKNAKKVVAQLNWKCSVEKMDVTLRNIGGKA